MATPLEKWGKLWQDPANLKGPQDYWPVFQGHWVDPDPDCRGMLAGDRIQFYAEKLGMIFPFDPKNRLKPASYELTLGPRYQIEGRDGVLTEEKPWLVIKENSIAFVSMNERLMLPHYIAARFNLSIDLIYKGLLLGTGSQVDPGFKGVLSCPLHNISNNEIRLRLDQPFAKIDFVKTTGIGEKSREKLDGITDEDELYKLAERREIVGYGDYTNPLFNRDKCWREPILDYPPGAMRVSSSVAPLARMVKRWRIAGFIGLAVFLTITVSLIALGVVLLRLYFDHERDWRNHEATVQRLEADVKRIDLQINPPGATPPDVLPAPENASVELMEPPEE